MCDEYQDYIWIILTQIKHEWDAQSLKPPPSNVTVLPTVLIMEESILFRPQLLNAASLLF